MESYVAAMTKLKELEPAAWARLEILLSDLQKSPKNAYAATEGHEIAQWVACFWDAQNLTRILDSWYIDLGGGFA